MSTRWLTNRWLMLGARMSVGGVFVYAGAVKLLAPESFADSIASFRLLPRSAISLLALGLPPFEMAVGSFLLVGWQVRAAALGALLMATVFAVALASAMVRGVPVDCGCFGVESLGSPGWMLLGRDLAMGGVAFLVYCGQAAARMAGLSERPSRVLGR